jgi:putative tryptophan/tyrosine transport system substrate-binding protein
MSSYIRSFFFIIFPLLFISLFFFHRSPDLPTIAITQIIDHHTLDEVREGMVGELAKQGYQDGKTVQLVYENANGNVAIATQIANKFIHLKPKVIVALSTQSAQLLKTQAQANQIPLIFTAVTDPISAKLVMSAKATAEGVTGVSDYMKPEPQLAMMKQFVPHLTKLGVLFNPSEINSVVFLESLEKIAGGQGIVLVKAAVNSTAEAANAVNNLIGKVDAVYFPNDNTVMAAASVVAQVGIKHKVPIFANDSASVKLGCVAALAYNRTAMGQVTAHMVKEILEGKSTEQLPVDYDSTPKAPVVNMQTLAAIGLNLPSFEGEELVQKIES